MTDSTRRPFPVRDPAPGPAVILDLPRLWAAVEREARRRGMVHHTTGEVELKAIADATGIDRSTIGRIRTRAVRGEIPTGQRAGINVNAAWTLVSFAHDGRAAAFGKELRGGIDPYVEPFDADQHVLPARADDWAGGFDGDRRGHLPDAADGE